VTVVVDCFLHMRDVLSLTSALCEVGDRIRSYASELSAEVSIRLREYLVDVCIGKTLAKYDYVFALPCAHLLVFHTC
jgi:hypothetical protein